MQDQPEIQRGDARQAGQAIDPDHLAGLGHGDGDLLAGQREHHRVEHGAPVGRCRRDGERRGPAAENVPHRFRRDRAFGGGRQRIEPRPHGLPSFVP